MKRTLTIRILTLFKGEQIGTDESGNQYYQECSILKRWIIDQSKGQKHKLRRWVIYKDGSDPSLVSPEWYSWLHFITNYPLKLSEKHPWQQPYQANATGTRLAHKPTGSLLRRQRPNPSRYQCKGWTPPG